MKKHFCLALVVFIPFCFVSCSGNAPATKEDSVVKRDATKDSIKPDTHQNAPRIKGNRPVGDSIRK